MIPKNAPRNAAPDPRDGEIVRLKRQLAESRERERSARTEERERFSALSAASRRFASSMRSRMDDRQRQQRRLDAQYAVSRVLEESRDLGEAAPEVFRALGSRLGWRVGVLWTVREGTLQCDGLWYSNGPRPENFEEACRGHRFPRGAGLPGRVWRREEPCWVEDVLADEGYVRRDVAAAEGLRCALAFPIQDGGRLVGVFELLKAETSPEDKDTVRTTYLVGHQMGQFVERRRAEAERDRALFREREARRQVSDVLESIDDAFFAVDRGWRFTYVNRRAEESWGRPRGELIGKNMWEEFPRAVGSDSRRELHRAMDERGTVGFEALSPVTGSWISARAYPSAEGISVYFRDITEGKKAEEALRSSEERFRALVSKGADMITVSDRGGNITYASPTTELVSGYTPEEFATLHPFDTIHPEDRPRCESAFRRLMDEPGLSLDLGHRGRHKDGSWRWIEGTFTSLFHDPAIRGIVANVRDVTGRKEAEERLTESEARFRAAFEQARIGIVEVSLDARVLLPNAGFCNIVGYTEDEARGLHVGDFTHPDDLEGDMEQAARVMEGEIPGYSIEKRYVRKDGRVVWVNLTSTLVRDAAGEPLYALAMVEDIDERKRAEERQAYSLKLADKLRPLTDPVEVQATASRVLGEHLGADRAYYVEIEEANGELVVARDYHRPGAPSHARRYPLDDWQMPWLADGETWVVRDVDTDPTMPDDQREAYRGNHIGAAVVVPLVKEDRLVATLVANQGTPRPWTPQEVSLIEDTAERTWAAVERARVAEALRESEERARALIKNLPGAAAFVLDRDLRYVLADGEALHATGRTPADYEGKTIREALGPELAERLEPELRRALGGEAFETERDQGPFAFVSRGVPLMRGGVVAGVLVVSYDISDRRRSEKILREYDEWLRIAQRAARAGTWEWDLSIDEIRWSSEHRELFGFAPSDEPVKREDWWAAVHPGDLPRIEEAGRRCSEEGAEWPEEIEYRIFRDGEVRWISARGQTEKDAEDRAVRIRGISVDATERKRAEEERDRLLAREWVAAAEAAERERISRELHDRVAHSIGVAHQSLQLYEVLAERDPEKAALKLDLAKATTKASLESTRNLSAELRHLDAEENLEAELRHLLEVAVPPHVGSGISVKGDESPVPGYVRGQLFLILREAVRNAVAHSGCASISVSLEFEDGKVVGRVEDDGVGFDATDGNGGVGLRSMRERTALLDGALDLSCEPGRGTRVSVLVPLKGER